MVVLCVGSDGFNEHDSQGDEDEAGQEGIV